MKFAAPVLLLLAGIVIAEANKISHDITSQNVEAINLNEEVWSHLKEILLSAANDGKDAEAEITEYATKIVKLLQTLIITKGFEPLELSNQIIKLVPTGTCTLTNGKIRNLSSMSLLDLVIVKYNHNTKILDITVPLAFQSLSIQYKYHAQIILLGISGGIEADIKNIHLNLHMGFNFTSYNAFVDKAEITNSGSILVKFTGQGMVDWVMDLLTGEVTALFHGIILSVINTVINVPVNNIVNTINNVIDSILQNNNSTFY